MVFFFPLKKLRRNGKCLLSAAILLFVTVAVYREMFAARERPGDSGMDPDVETSLKRALFDQKKRSFDPDYVVDSGAWSSNYVPQAWKPEYLQHANLHVFEDWCGSSTADLRKSLHFPLYPHSRTTVQKLAVSPQWTNYGLRIFGYLHPYANGAFLFAVSSDDNSEFWLSTDESPANLQLLAWVGKTGKEWTAPGEFEKYARQTSRPVWLSSQMRYFFEVIHKQNDKGTDHVEVAWRLLEEEPQFKVIESKHISLYVDESALLMSDVVHIPQTAASHQHTSSTQQYSDAADMLMEDPRDTVYKVPLINSKFLLGVLPDCTYQPSYTIKDFPLARYQGLRFVHMSYVYPNDYTRLTHMESENTCFYPESSYYLNMFGFSRYMKLDRTYSQGNAKAVRDFGFHGRKTIINEEDDFDEEAYHREREARLDQADNNMLPDYGDDYDDYGQKRRRKLFALVMQETNNTKPNATDSRLDQDQLKGREHSDNNPQPQPAPDGLQESSHKQMQVEPNQMDSNQGRIKTVIRKKTKGKRRRKKQKSVAAVRVKEKNPDSTPAVRVSEQDPESRQMNHSHIQAHQSLERKSTVSEGPTEIQQAAETQVITQQRNARRSSSNQRHEDDRKRLREKEIDNNMPLQQDVEEASIIRGKKAKVSNRTGNGRDARWEAGGDFDGADDEDLTPAPFDTEVNWSQTFQVKPLDLQRLRSDWIDLSCNVSGNLLVQAGDVLPVVNAFMEQLIRKHGPRFTLVRVVNIVKRVDGYKGSRYLLELELKEVDGQLLHLSHYIYTLNPHSRRHGRESRFRQPKPELLLCNPVGFRWNPAATVHFIVPVKNQARWVLQLIADMEELHRETGDSNFNLIIVDYQSTDMDVRKALGKSSLPRYEYVKLTGNFERSAGLQAGVNLIHDNHSIVFLCDLHIHFPLSIIHTIRKHCVEGYMAFAPIVMRLDCGATPLDARGSSRPDWKWRGST
ncbi:N-acetyl-beta-glucosaminyl-glycoprotein 4-beta-N-acetylgalactosaminyltransferase 1 isoform X2 [Betta splendens]|uniref:Beta-1,4-N-acetylgalactosaminyltransferase n=1 Tax=Betta splendens TaxID=158456 RepID=A0A6P7MVN1_BETSP|nr:N-acetyl-beta-glucosaminyl-glycoprotein 4-beta-N-acetylgalactosaminyltransferase 1 isoform X2 [Betta splendens]